MDDQLSQHAFAKKCIYDALIRLLEHKSLRDLTITEITRMAGVSRMAYYRNFESKEDILRCYVDDLFVSYVNALQINGDFSVHSFIVTALGVFRQNAALMREIAKEKLEGVLIKQFEGYLGVLSSVIFRENYEESVDTRFYASFIAGGAANMVLRWIEEGMVQKEEEMALFIVDFVNNETLLNLSAVRDKTQRCFQGGFAARTE